MREGERIMDNIRHLVEHLGLPMCLYCIPSFPSSLRKDPGKTVLRLFCWASGLLKNYTDTRRCDEGTIESRLWWCLCRRNPDNNEYCGPYRESDFRFVFHDPADGPDDDRRIIIINMPYPEELSECRRVFICYHEGYGPSVYYTVERGARGLELCSWDVHANHHNYCDAPATEKAQLRWVLKMFKKAGGNV